MSLSLPLGGREIDHNASLVAIQGEEIHRVITQERFASLAHGVAFGRLNLDHISPEVGQEHRTERPVHHLREIQDAQSLQCTSHVVSPTRSIIGSMDQPK
ncbi:hypothetical protein D9M69_517590 [compost metagenome]